MVRMTIGAKAQREREPRRVHVAAVAQDSSVACIQRCEFCAEELLREVAPPGGSVIFGFAWPPGTLVVKEMGLAPMALDEPLGPGDVVCTPLPPRGTP